jgi:DNA-binding CsgD family transcriptional regulator
MAVDGDLRIIGWSETMADITGVGGNAALGRPCWEVVAGFDERGEPVCEPDCRVAREAWTEGGTPRLRLAVPRGQRRTDVEMSTSKALVVGGAALVHVFHRRGLHFTDAAPLAASLTPRQREVLVLLGEGLSTAAIAARLGLSKETVRNHVRAVLQELAVHSRLEAVVEARRRGLL